VAGVRLQLGHITATLDFASGVTGTLLQHRFPKMDTSAYQMEVYGSEGRVVWKSDNAWHLPVPHTVPNAAGVEWEELPLVFPASYDSSGPASEADYGYNEWLEAEDRRLGRV
jgi:predicted dehydrogenase